MTCPICHGKCCRDVDSGYRVEHMAAEVYVHGCDHCADGTGVGPETTDVRTGIVAWMRAVADVYATQGDLIGDGYARNWRVIADLIEQGADTRPIPMGGRTT